MATLSLPMETFPFGTPLATDFLNRHFPDREVLKVPRIGDAPAGGCYGNVYMVVQQRGGAAQDGWVLCWWKGHLVEALHHAVWKTPNGDLLDVTAPAYDGMSENFIYFISDDSRNRGLSLAPGIASIFHQLDSNDGVADFISLRLEHMNLVAERNKLVRSPTPQPQQRILEIEARGAFIEKKLKTYTKRFRLGKYGRFAK